MSLQSKPGGWQKEDWELFLQVWTGLAVGSPVQGINRGGEIKSTAACWKRHFTNYTSQPYPLSASELEQAKKDLDKDGKSLPELMKEDIANKRVARPEIFYLPDSTPAEEEWHDQQYAQFKVGDPGYEIHILLYSIPGYIVQMPSVYVSDYRGLLSYYPPAGEWHDQHKAQFRVGDPWYEIYFLLYSISGYIVQMLYVYVSNIKELLIGVLN